MTSKRVIQYYIYDLTGAFASIFIIGLLVITLGFASSLLSEICQNIRSSRLAAFKNLVLRLLQTAIFRGKISKIFRGRIRPLTPLNGPRLRSSMKFCMTTHMSLTSPLVMILSRMFGHEVTGLFRVPEEQKLSGDM